MLEPRCPGLLQREGRLFFLVLSETGVFFLGTGSTATCQAWMQGRLPPSPLPLQHGRWISCASDPGFLTEEEEGGRGVRVFREAREKELFLKIEDFLFIMPVDE